MSLAVYSLDAPGCFSVFGMIRKLFPYFPLWILFQSFYYFCMKRIDFFITQSYIFSLVKHIESTALFVVLHCFPFMHVKNSFTFHIFYQAEDRSLRNEE